MTTGSTQNKIILITGSQGQLGSEFHKISSSFPQYQFIFSDRKTLDITDEQAVNDFFSKNKITVCVNCAAYTAVDKAEQEKELAEKVNTTAVGYLAKACKDHYVQFMHISTDYVFNGKATRPYLSTDQTNPVNFYGSAKLSGEQMAIALNDKTIIIRTAWVYSSFGNNFVKTMMRLMKDRESIGVVNDQLGSPTYAGDLAEAIMHIINQDHFIPDVYHYTNEGITTWYNFAKEIAMLIKTKCVVNPISTEQFPTLAARPAYSVLNTEKIQSIFNLQIPNWQDSLQKCLAEISAQ